MGLHLDGGRLHCRGRGCTFGGCGLVGASGGVCLRTLGGGNRILVTSAGAIAFNVQDIDLNLCESGQGQGLRCHIRQGRRGSQADFNEAFDAQSLGRSTEEQVLGFDPANRGSELPGEKLDEQGTRGRLRIGRGLVPIIDELLCRLGRNNLEDRQCEVPTQLEGARNQVRNVATLEDIEVDALGKQGIELVAEGRNACAQS